MKKENIGIGRRKQAVARVFLYPGNGTIVINKVGSQSKIINMDLPKDDPKQRRPCIDEALRKLNWKPTVGRKLDDFYDS